VTARTAQRFIGAVVILEAASTVLFLRAADYSLTILNDPARLLHAGARGADLIWLGSVLDMLGYLAAIPVALYLRERFGSEPGSDLFTLAGVAFMLLGAAAAIAFATAGPQLIREYAASPSGRFATLKAFETLYRIVFYGIWQTLDAALAGVWGRSVSPGWRRSIKRPRWHWCFWPSAQLPAPSRSPAFPESFQPPDDSVR